VSGLGIIYAKIMRNERKIQCSAVPRLYKAAWHF
jgi:hypothetical protein